MHHGQKANVLVPLFPGYTFVHIALQWHAARWSPGIVRLVMAGEAPAHVRDCIISELRQRERGGIIPIPRNGFQIGDPVRVISGPFTGRPAIYSGQSAHERG